MGRKLKGRHAAATGKGLKGALLRHEASEKMKQNVAASLKASREQEELKQKSIKGGVGHKKSKKHAHHQQHLKGIVPFNKDQTLLLVGEGDFSFARALIEENLILAENLVATSYDSKAIVIEKYPHVEETLKFLEDEGVIVEYEIDATNLVKSFKLKASGKRKHTSIFPSYKRLDNIMFNFPHTGRGMKDQLRNIRDHQQLVDGYFKSCKEIYGLVNNSLSNDFAGYNTSSDSAEQGQIILSLFEGEPYNSWNIKILGRSNNLKVERSGKFDFARFPGYEHRRTDGMGNTTKPAIQRDARVYVFTDFGVLKVKEKKDSDDED